MEVKVVPRAPQAHCYQCGGTAIVAICHHCGRPMCSQHIGKYSRPLEWLQHRLLAPLRLKPHSEQPALHCKQCRHMRQIMLTLVLFVLVLVGLALAVVLWLEGHTTPAVILVSLSLVIFFAMLLTPRRHINIETKSWGIVTPVFPRTDRLRIVERYRGVHIHLDQEGRYRLFIQPPEGMLSAKFALNPPRLTHWQRIVQRLRPRSTISTRFNAGFLVLHGRVGVNDVTVDPPTLEPLPCPVIPLIGERMLSGSNQKAEGEAPSSLWNISQSYRLAQRTDRRQFPVQIIPSLQPDSERHTLELCVQFIQPAPSVAPITPKRFNLLKLTVPVTWGEVEYSTRNAQVSKGTDPETGEGVRRLTWERFPISQRHADEGRQVLRVRFDQEIEQASEIRAFVEVVFTGVQSGMIGASLFSPLGTLSEQMDPDNLETIVQIDFVGYLQSLRYQRVRTLPSPNRDDATDDLEPFLSFPGVAPTPEAIVRLSNRLSARDYYIQWIVENPPHTGERAEVSNHYWDIGGRYYEGVCPVDFHLVVTGHEVHGTRSVEQPHETKVVLSVQGVYTTDSMALEVDRIYKELRKLIQETLELPAPADEDDSSSGEPS